MTIEAFNIDGSAGSADVRRQPGAWACATPEAVSTRLHNGNSAVPNQLNHAPDFEFDVMGDPGDPGSSESIVISFDEGGACGFSFEYTRAIQGEQGGEVGRWTAYDADGNEIGTGLFGNPHTVTAGTGRRLRRGVGVRPERHGRGEGGVHRAALCDWRF